MSKQLKNLITEELRRRLSGVGDALLVSLQGLDTISNNRLRKDLHGKNIRVLVVKNSLARRATEGTPLSAAFSGIKGSVAVVWGGDDIVSLAKEVNRILNDPQYKKAQPCGGALDGATLGAADIEKISKWPSRKEVLSQLVGQILGPGAKLSSQVLGPGRTLAGQVKKKSEGEEAAGDAAPAAEGPGAEGPAAEGPAAEGAPA